MKGLDPQGWGRRRGVLLGMLLAASGITWQSAAGADDAFQLLRIGTGGSAGTYYPIGTLIAQALSDPPYGTGGPPNHRGQTPPLLVLAQRANGSVANATELGLGLLEAGLVQADVAHWAHHGTGPFANRRAVPGLRAVATLYPESLHLVARTQSGIRAVTDLYRQRVALDEPGSGTLIDVIRVLAAFGLGVDDIEPVYLKPIDAITRLRADELDAFFIIAGYPIRAVAELLEDGDGTLVPIAGPAVDRLLRDSPFFSRDTIAPNAYPSIDTPVDTVAVGAQLLVRADLDVPLIYRLTQRLWSLDTQTLLTAGHPKGRQIRLETALEGISIPLHPGAAHYYQEAGLLPRGDRDGDGRRLGQ